MKIVLFAVCLLSIVSCKEEIKAPDSNTNEKEYLYSLIPDGEKSNYYYEEIQNDYFSLMAYNLKSRLKDTLNISPQRLKSELLTSIVYFQEKRDDVKGAVIDTNNVYFGSMQTIGDKLITKIKKKKLEILFDTVNAIPVNLGIYFPYLPPPPINIAACFAYYNTHFYPALIQQANTTCQPVYYCLGCPIGSPGVFFFIVVQPNSLDCFMVEDDAVIDYIGKNLPTVLSSKS